ncbi:MAG: hypothetical protein NTW59_02710 [Candidatus Diapherotrites archaeon]|nr:hypothetical protein [Candidatus Diapherotrites archaeon]
MARHKDEEFKRFLISERKRVGPGMTNAPVWVLQKAGRRIWNPKAKRSWKEADFGDAYRKRKRRERAHKRRQKD